MRETTVILILLILTASTVVLGLGMGVVFPNVGEIMSSFLKRRQKMSIAHDVYGEPPLDAREPVVGQISAFGYDERLSAIEKRITALEERANSRETIVINTPQALDETTMRRMAEVIARGLNPR